MKKPLLFLLLIFVFSCKKEESKPAPVERTESFTVSKVSVVPLEILILTLEKATDEKSLELRFGSSAITAKQIDGDQYGFMVPETISQGTYELKLKDGAKTLSLTVGNSMVISNPTAYTQDFIRLAQLQFEKLKSIQDTLIRYGLTSTSSVAEERDMLDKKLKEISAQLNALSAQDKLMCARMIAANRTGLDALHNELQGLGAGASLAGGRVMADCPLSPTDDYVKCMVPKLKKLLGDVMIESVLIVGFLEVGRPDLASAAGLLYLMDLYVLRELSQSFTNLLAVHTGEASEISEAAGSKPNEYRSGSSRAIGFRSLFVNIHKGIVRSLVTQAILDFVDSLEALNTLLSGKLGVMFPVKFELPAIRKGKRLPETFDRLKVTVLNNPKVTAAISDFKNGLFNLKFISTEKTDQVFDYKISYQYADKAIEKTVVNNKLLAAEGGVDLSDCTIKSTDGEPISKPGVTDKQYKFTLEGTCKFPPKTLFFWDFGDGDTDEAVDNPTAYHKFTKNGDFTVKVRVLAEGSTEYVNREVKVKIEVSDDTGPDYFTYKANGKVFSSSDPRTFFVGDPINRGLFIDYLNSFAGYKGVSGRGWDAAHLWMYMGVSATQHLLVGSYPLTKPEKGKPALALVAFDSGSTEFADSGTLTITRRDGSGLAGEFSFNVKGFAITEGKFRITWE